MPLFPPATILAWSMVAWPVISCLQIWSSLVQPPTLSLEFIFVLQLISYLDVLYFSEWESMKQYSHHFCHCVPHCTISSLAWPLSSHLFSTSTWLFTSLWIHSVVFDKTIWCVFPAFIKSELFSVGLAWLLVFFAMVIFDLGCLTPFGCLFFWQWLFYPLMTSFSANDHFNSDFSTGWWFYSHHSSGDWTWFWLTPAPNIIHNHRSYFQVFWVSKVFML